ncbi:polyprenol monophosphomannose synthase [Candidatus Uhrbacteria bacterium]|nr:polyprenol monophosphomannose synthase [Candidatus Uhrbacteria bacterium]
MKTLIIIPTYNERENLETAVTEIVSGQADGADVLVVDDNSPDGTGALAEDLVRSFPARVQVLHRPAKLGLGSAYIDGFRYAVDRGYDLVCQMDADGSHDPHDVRRLVDAMDDHTDIVIGSRRVPGAAVLGWGPRRHFMSAAAMAAARLMLGLSARDVTSGFRCYRGRAAAHLLRQPIVSRGFAFQEEVLLHCQKAGFRIKEIPVTFRNRQMGKSKLGWREVADFLLMVLRARR